MDEKLIAIVAGIVVTGGTILYFVIKWLTKTITYLLEKFDTTVNNNTDALNGIKKLLTKRK